jgi:WD40 repeat protein
MIPGNKHLATEEPDVEALLAFDRALIAGDAPPATIKSTSFLQPVHECQRLLEAVWPRGFAASAGLPKQLGHFSIVRELGRGGFGVVFLAEDLVLGRPVALKVPRPEVLITPELRRRFVREAEVASRLDHPHIVPVYEVGDDGAICFIASAYCEGMTLAQWLRVQKMSVPIRVAVRLMSDLAAAVAHAHDRGILHRDLKPGNILLQRRHGGQSTTDGAGPDIDYIPRICDFGLAKLIDQVSPDTRSGMPIGSPAYMAPEQAAGRVREHGPATDVYALGVILYELLTGTPPHRGETDLETLRLVVDQDPPSPRVLRPGVPRDLETIALKCLEKRPARRYSNARELSADLQRFLDGRPVKARPVPAWERAGKWARRRPVHTALGVVLGAAVLVFVVGLEWARVREKRYRDAIGLANDRLRRSETEARDQRTLADRERLQNYQRHVATQVQAAAPLVERKEYGQAMSILDTLGPPERLRDARGFAWHYLDRIVRPPVTMLPALPKRIRAVAYSRDGRTIALADEANNTFVMERETGTLRELQSQHKFPFCVRLLFSSDGRTLASLAHPVGRFDSEVKLWDVASGAELEGMTENLGYCYQMVFSPGGETFVTIEAVLSNPNPPVRSWRLSSDRKHVTLRESIRSEELKTKLSPANRTAHGTNGIFRLSDVLAVTPEDESTLAVWSETDEIWLYTTAGGYNKAICRLQESEVVFIPRTDLAVPYTQAVVDEIGRVAIAVTGALTARPIRHGVTVLGARFSRDGRTAAVQEPYPGHPDGKLRLIDIGTGRVGVESPWGDLWAGCYFDFTPDRDALLAVGKDAQARLWDFSQWRAPISLSGHAKEVWGLAFSPNGRTLVSSSDDATLKLWEVASGLERATLKGHIGLVAAVAYSPDGSLLASAGWDKTIRLWKAGSGESMATLEGHRDRVRTLAFSPDGRTLASGSSDGTVRLWDVIKMRPLRAPLVGHNFCVFSVAFAPDGKTLYSGGIDKTIRLWDWEEGRLCAAWSADEQVYALACSPDGQMLATGHRSGTVTLWDVARQKARPPMRAHVHDVLGVAFSPDGRTLASASRDQSVRLWDPATGLELMSLNGHKAPVNGIAFSPDGTILATGSHDGAIKLWHASPGLPKSRTIAPVPEP